MNCYIVDDERHSVDMVAYMLGNIRGVNVVGNNINPVKALAEIKVLNNVDLVITDIDMPEMSGITMAKLLPAHISVIFISANLMRHMKEWTLNAAALLTKPLDPVKFEAAITGVLASRSRGLDA